MGWAEGTKIPFAGFRAWHDNHLPDFSAHGRRRNPAAIRQPPLAINLRGAGSLKRHRRCASALRGQARPAITVRTIVSHTRGLPFKAAMERFGNAGK
jgi:hypothetical protein